MAHHNDESDPEANTEITSPQNDEPPRGQVNAVIVVWYLQDYKTAIEVYSRDPSEPRQSRFWIFLILLASVVGAITIGAFGGVSLGQLHLRAIVCWEVIAIVDTLIFAIMYFSDLMTEAGAKPARMDFGPNSVLIGIIWLLNFIFLLAAGGALLYSEHPLTPITLQTVSVGFNWWYVGYLFSLFLSFMIFVALDYRFARDSKVFKKVREYWGLCLFVDGPATIAFIVLLVYLLVLYKSGRAVSLDIMSGAVAMQMLIADTLYLVIASNFHHWLLANRLSKGVDQ